MTKQGILFFFMAAVTCWGQTADELISKNLAARGGAEKLRAIRTMQMTGSLSFTDQPMPFRVRAKRPSMIREDIQEPGGDLTRAYDGKLAWQRLTSKKNLSGKATPLSDGPLENLRQEGE